MKMEFAFRTIPLLFHLSKFFFRLYNFCYHCIFPFLTSRLLYTPFSTVLFVPSEPLHSSFKRSVSLFKFSNIQALVCRFFLSRDHPARRSLFSQCWRASLCGQYFPPFSLIVIGSEDSLLFAFAAHMLGFPFGTIAPNSQIKATWLQNHLHFLIQQFFGGFFKVCKQRKRLLMHKSGISNIGCNAL